MKPWSTGDPNLEGEKKILCFYPLLNFCSAEEGVNCKDLLTSRDKVEIVKATFAYIAGKDGLWNRLSIAFHLFKLT